MSFKAFSTSHCPSEPSSFFFFFLFSFFFCAKLPHWGVQPTTDTCRYISSRFTTRYKKNLKMNGDPTPLHYPQWTKNILSPKCNIHHDKSYTPNSTVSWWNFTKYYITFNIWQQYFYQVKWRSEKLNQPKSNSTQLPHILWQTWKRVGTGTWAEQLCSANAMTSTKVSFFNNNVRLSDEKFTMFTLVTHSKTVIFTLYMSTILPYPSNIEA